MSSLGSRSRLAFQIVIKPLNGALHGIDLVFAFDKAVSFIRIIVRSHSFAFLLQNRLRLLCFFLGSRMSLAPCSIRRGALAYLKYLTGEASS